MRALRTTPRIYARIAGMLSGNEHHSPLSRKQVAHRLNMSYAALTKIIQRSGDRRKMVRAESVDRRKRPFSVGENI